MKIRAATVVKVEVVLLLGLFLLMEMLRLLLSLGGSVGSNFWGADMKPRTYCELARRAGWGRGWLSLMAASVGVAAPVVVGG